MKKTLVLFLMVCGIILTNSIQAKNLDNINEVWQNNNSQSWTETQDISTSSDLNAEASHPASSLIILVIVGFFLTKKHLNLAKKHRDIAKKH